MKNAGIVVMGGLALAGCVSTPRAATPGRVAVPPPRYSSAGLETVLGVDAAALVRAFGEPDKDIRETGAHKLQFIGPFCVLDTYLYPKNGSEPVVTYVDARQPDGRDMDRASCVAAMQRRHGGR